MTDITYPRTYQAFLYLTVVLDLYLRMVVYALMRAAWRRPPKQPVIIDTGQGVQYGSDDW